MPRRLVFAVGSPLGYRVTLTRNRWREIVRYKHPALAGKEDALQHCLRDPEVIRKSAKDDLAHLYYRRVDRGYLCVIVGTDERGYRLVLTAYYTKTVKKGDELWTR